LPIIWRVSRGGCTKAVVIGRELGAVRRGKGGEDDSVKEERSKARGGRERANAILPRVPCVSKDDVTWKGASFLLLRPPGGRRGGEGGRTKVLERTESGDLKLGKSSL